MKQPELTDEWGCDYHGQAKTVTGDIWWYEDPDGRRYPLRPKLVTTDSSLSEKPQEKP